MLNSSYLEKLKEQYKQMQSCQKIKCYELEQSVREIERDIEMEYEGDMLLKAKNSIHDFLERNTNFTEL